MAHTLVVQVHFLRNCPNTALVCPDRHLVASLQARPQLNETYPQAAYLSPDVVGRRMDVDPQPLGGRAGSLSIREAKAPLEAGSGRPRKKATT